MPSDAASCPDLSVELPADSAEWVRESGGGHIPMIGTPDARHHLMLDQPAAFACVLKTILVLFGKER